MPTAQDLDRLRALLAQLKQVGSVQPGERILAADWNTLAGVIADLAQAVLAAETVATVPPHQHRDQVALDWVSQGVRAIIQRGPLADPAAQNQLAAIAQTLQRFGAGLDETRITIEDFRGRLTDVATNDLARETAVTNVQRSLSNVIDPRPDIAAMRASLDALQTNLVTVQRAAASLTVGGALVDVGALAGRVSNLEQFREGLKAANGQQLDGRTIENRFAQLQASAVTQDQLLQAFKDHPVVIPADQIQALETSPGTNLRDQGNTHLQTCHGQIHATPATRFSG